MQASNVRTDQVFAAVADAARAAGVFAEVRVSPDRVECPAKASAAPAFYRVERDGGRVWVTLVTPDRWLSQSIEADLVHTGDKLGELIEEELVNLGGEGPVAFEHFRSEDKLFTFRTAVDPKPGEAPEAFTRRVSLLLLAYEACFVHLGDMNAGDDDD